MCFENATPRTADVDSYEAPPPIFKEVNYYEMSVSFRVELNHYIQISFTSVNPLTAERALRALVDFTLSNARRFYSSMGNPLDRKVLSAFKSFSLF